MLAIQHFVNNRECSINYHMHAHNLITDAQYGFVKGRSTELQLLKCTNIWIKSMDQKLFTDTVYIDHAITKSSIDLISSFLARIT